MPRFGLPLSALTGSAARFGLSHQQRYEERKGQQSGHALPDLKRGALVKRARPANFGRRTRGSGFHLEREFGHVAKTLGGIERDRPREHHLEPSGKIRS